MPEIPDILFDDGDIFRNKMKIWQISWALLMSSSLKKILQGLSMK